MSVIIQQPTGTVSVSQATPQTITATIPNVTGPKGDTGDTGAAGPNVLSTSTTTAFTGLMRGDGSTVKAVTLGAGLAFTGDTLDVAGSGTGDVVGPASAVDSNFVSFDTTTGKLVKDSGSKASDFATSGHNHTGVYAPALGEDDNYVTDAEKTKLSNLSGTNTGDQDLSGYSPTSHRHVGEDVGAVNSLSYDITPATIPTAVGATYWDEDSQTLAIVTSADTTLQVGEEIAVMCKNGDTVDHLNGQPVYVSGGNGKRPVVKLADADAHNTAHVIYLATQNVAYTGSGLGKYTALGSVNSVPYTNVIASTDNYVDWTEGTLLYVSSETGKLTKTRPAAPSHAVEVGFISDKTGNNISITVSTNRFGELSELHDVDLTESKTTPVDADSVLIQDTEDSSIWKKLSFTNAKAFFKTYFDSIYAPTANGVTNGDSHNHSGGDGGQIDHTALSNVGTFTHANLDAIITDITEPTGFLRNGTIPTITVVSTTGIKLVGTFSYYWKGVKATVTTETNTVTCEVGVNFIYFDDATGVLKRSGAAWSFDNSKVMAVYAYYDGTINKVFCELHGSQMDASTHGYLHSTVGMRYTSGLAGTFTAYNNFSVAAGVVNDEDITIDYLNPTTQITRVYLNGSSTWIWSAPSSTIPYINGTDVQYNNAGTLTNATALRYIPHYIYASGEINSELICIVGTGQYTSQALAEAASLPTTLPAQDMKLLYLVVVRNNTATFTTTAIDYRGNSVLPTSGTTSIDHGTLLGLSDLDHPASAIINTPAGSISATTVQAAIDELDSEKEPVLTGATAQTAVDADTVISLSGTTRIKSTWTNIKAFLKTYYDTIYSPIAGPGSSQAFATGALTSTTGTFSDVVTISKLGSTTEVISALKIISATDPTRYLGAQVGNARLVGRTSNVDGYITFNTDLFTYTINGIAGYITYNSANKYLFNLVASGTAGAALGAVTTPLEISTTGLAVTGAVSATGILSTSDTTDATSTTAASLKTAGGLAVAKKLYVGTGGAVIDGLAVNRGYGAANANIAIGTAALSGSSLTGNYNLAIGNSALVSVTSGAGNVGLGHSAGANITTGSYNYAIGYAMIGAVVTGDDNIAAGYNSSNALTSGAGNVAIGAHSANAITSGAENICLGRYAAYYLTQGSNNVVVGARTAYGLTTGSNNTIIGSNVTGLSATLANNVILSDGAGNKTIHSGNGLTVALQGATPASGCGITFPATQNASSDANTLDDYEEGTWTPTQGAGLTVVGAFSSSGFYTKIGNQITVWGHVAGATSVAVNSNSVICAGLPFAARTTAPLASGTAINNSTNFGAAIQGYSSSVYACGDFSATGAIHFSFNHFV